MLWALKHMETIKFSTIEFKFIITNSMMILQHEDINKVKTHITVFYNEPILKAQIDFIIVYFTTPSSLYLYLIPTK